MRPKRSRLKLDSSSGKADSAAKTAQCGSGIWALLLALSVLAIALPTIQNRLVLYDDAIYLGRPVVAGGLSWTGITFAFTSVSDLYWHPIAWLSHEIDVSLFGMNPAGHHFTSALLQSVAAGLLFLLLRRLGAGIWASAAGTLIWAIHPLRVESFAWVAERKDVLCALFFIAAILAYLRDSTSPTWRGYLTWVGLGFLALMSKPTAVCLVPVLFILDCWPLERRILARGLLLEKAPLIVLTLVVTALTVYGQKESGAMSHLANVPASVRLGNVPVFYLRYIGKVLWPLDLACFYAYGGPPGTGMVLASLAAILIPTAVAVGFWRRWPWLLAGWAWFLVCLLPNIGLLQAGRQSVADRFTNLAMIGIAVSVALSLSHFYKASTARLTRRLITTLVLATIVGLTLLTERQIGYWHDSVRLFEHAVEVDDNDYVRANLGLALLTEGRYAEAEPHLLAAVSRAPLNGDYHNNLANVLLRTGKTDQAAAEAAIALRLEPNSTAAVATMSSVLFRQGDYRRTLAQFDRAIELGVSPKALAAQLSDMGASIASRGRPNDAEPFVRRAVQMDPSLVKAWKNLVVLMIDLKRIGDAQVELRRAIQATGNRPEYATVRRELDGDRE